MSFKLNEAIEYAKENGKKVRKIDLARKLWGKSKDNALRANFANLSKGRSKKVNIEYVEIICKELGISADYLFGLVNEPTREREVMEAIENSPQAQIANKIKEILPQLKEISELSNNL